MSNYDPYTLILDVRMKRDPQDADALFKKADILYERFGRAEEALELYDTAIVFGIPQGPDMQVWASRLRRHKRYKMALDLLCEFTRTSQYPGTWLEIGECLIELGRYNEALASFEKAMGYGPTNRHAWLFCGSALEKMGHNEEALKAYDKAIEPNPDDWYSSDRPDRNMWAPYALSSKARLLSRLSGGDRTTTSTE